MYKLYFGVIFTSLLFGCSSDNKFPEAENKKLDDELAGPCVTIEREPVIKLEGVTDQSTGESIAEVEIENISLNGDLFVFKENQQELLTNVDIDFINNTLVCTLPCAFLNQEGLYEFTVKTMGYSSETLQTQASYSVFDGGCPSYVDGGTEISFQLKRTTE